MVWFVGFLVLAGLAILQTILAGVQTHEHRRFARSRLRQRGAYWPKGRALVLIPCRGSDVEFEENLRHLFLQDYDDYEIRFLVESQDDPAYSVIRRTMAAHPEVDSRVIVAGRARHVGQKVHNLRVGTSELPDRVQYLVFVDGDARPDRQWLQTLIAGTNKEDVGATTGYRWFIPQRPTLPNLVLYSINSGVAMWFGRGRIAPNFVWGGSWAMRRDLFESLALRQAWDGVLCDDMVASRVIQRAGLRIAFEPACVLASPADGTTGQIASFLRRQYLLSRLDAPAAWAAALGLVNFGVLALWGSAFAALFGFPREMPTAVPLAVCVFLYLAHIYRTFIRQTLPRLYFPNAHKQLLVARWFDILLGPAVNVINGLVLISSAFGRRVTWRAITYRVLYNGKVRLLHRCDPSPEREKIAISPETEKRVARPPAA